MHTLSPEALAEIVLATAVSYRDSKGPEACRKHRVGAWRSALKEWRGPLVTLTPDIVGRVTARREAETFLAGVCKECGKCKLGKP